MESANEKMEHYRQLYNDCNRNKTNMEIALGSQMETLVQEKHTSQARVSDLEDRVAALQVEKEVLVDELRRTEGAKHTHSFQDTEAVDTHEADSLRNVRQSLQIENEQLRRQLQLLRSEATCSQVQVKANEATLHATLDAMQGVRGSPQSYVIASPRDTINIPDETVTVSVTQPSPLHTHDSLHHTNLATSTQALQTQPPASHPHLTPGLSALLESGANSEKLVSNAQK